MRRLLLIACCLSLLTFPLAFPALAQTTLQPTPAPPTAMNAADIATAVANAQGFADRAERASDDAERYADDSSRFFSLFEAFGIVAAIASVALGLYGATNVFTERRERKEERERFESELAQARNRLEDEMNAQRQGLDSLRRDLMQGAAEQHRIAEHATLALAMLPLAERQYKAQDLKGAAESYERALAFDPGNPLIHYRLGYTYVQSGSLDSAEKHLKQALQIDSDFFLATAALGYVYRRMGDRLPRGMDRDRVYNQSEAYLLEALQRAPKLVDEDGESWWGSLGGLYRRRGQIEQAVDAYNRAAAVTPHSSYPFSNLALLYMAANDREHMLRMYTQVLRLARGEAMADVDNYWAYADVLTSLLALGRTAEAEEALESVFAIAPPDSPYALESLADTLTRLRDALGGDKAAPYITPFIDRIRARVPAP